MKGRNVPPPLTPISEAEAVRIITSGTPGLVNLFVGHDDWCRYFKTGRPGDCNCNPEVEYFLIRELPPAGGLN